MKKTDEDFRICDTCDNFHVHPSGVSEHCSMVEKRPFSQFLPCYAESRINGEAKSCKEYRKVFKRNN